ncbi:DUF4097 domain-containing protein [Bacteroidota bacterium]
MKIFFKSAIFFIIATLITIAGVQDNGERTKSFKVNRGGELSVHVNPGDLTLKTWDKDEVFVKISGLEGDELDEVKLEQSGNRITVDYNAGWGWADDASFVITIPENFHVKMNTTGGNIDVVGNVIGRISANTSGGNISCMNVQGEFSAKTSGGNVEVGDVNGEIYVSTQGGNIEVGFVNGDKASLNTMGGNVIVKDVEGNLSAKTYGGDIKIGDVGGSADAVTYGGNIWVKNVEGSATLSTYGGNLYLESAKGKVEADTKGGNVSLKNTTGSVYAKTAAGNIYAELDPSANSECNLKTAHGEIEILLPESAKVSIEAVIKIRGWWDEMKDEFDIKSDFISEDVIRDEESEEIMSTYKLNGGGSKIKLKTVNSNIIIKKK